MEELELFLRQFLWGATQPISSSPSGLLLALQPALQLRLPTGQAHRWGRIPKIVKDCPSNVGASKSGKGRFRFRAEQFGGPDQPHQSHLDQIVLGFWAAKPVVVRNGRHQMPMGFYKGIAALKGLDLSG